MRIDEELYNLTCIKKMGGDYFQKWENIKNQYAPTLDRGSIYRPIAYTHHDYTHHCYNIYKIVGKVILHEPQLCEQEWFILNVAILLHDFSMTLSNFERLTHSKQSAEWILQQMNEDTVLRENLNSSEAEAIALIVEAHSDCKKKVDNKEEIEKYTLENEEIQELMDCDGAQNVQVKFLAAVLRIADECDVTRSRAGIDSFDMLDENNNEQKYSKEQWLQLKCFKRLERRGENLKLIVDDKYVKDHANEKNNVERRVKKVVLKIRKQLKYVRQQAVVTDKHLAMFPLRNVIIFSTELDSEYVKKINEGQLEEKEIPDLPVCILDDGLANKISTKIDEEDLLVMGHYIVTDDHCERDWIDLRDVVVDKKLANEIIDRISKDINDKYQNSTVLPIIVAMEENGLILASQIAYRLGYPFTYIIPCNFNLKRSSQQEKYVDFSSYDKFILITDAVATFRTMGITCREYGISDKVCEIYTVLYREPKDKRFFHEDAESLMRKMTVCCNKYSMEVHYRKKCPEEKNGKCKALNK